MLRMGIEILFDIINMAARSCVERGVGIFEDRD
jgi:hypothetical protein